MLFRISRATTAKEHSPSAVHSQEPPQVPEFVVQWQYPIMRMAPELNPECLRRPQAKQKVCSDREFLEKFVPEAPTSRKIIVQNAAEQGISSATVDRYLKRLTEAGLTCCNSGCYWAKNHENP